MVRLDNAVTTLLTNANRTSENMNELLDADNRRVFKQTLAELQVLAKTLAARSAVIDATLANAARTMDNTARFSGDLPRLVQRIQQSADAFDSMTRELAQAGTGANATLAGARGDLREASGETLQEVRLLASELREVTGSLRRFSEQLEQNPSMLLYGKPASRPGPGE
jgi:phospholipid/cholesterol/gamma-HCH transport system substrate-binding protein